MSAEPFFTRDGAALLPAAHAHGPWSNEMLHGRLLAGLAAWAVEREGGGDEFQPSRLTVDLYRAAPLAATVVATAVVRSGGRVRAVDAMITVDGQPAARASSLFLRRSEGEPDDVPVTEPWPAPAPSGMGEPQAAAGFGFELHPVSDDPFGGPVPRRVWVREACELVGGETLSPFVRASLAADFASPLGNFASTGIEYINADLTLHLGRLPVGEWIGLSSDDRVVDAGVSVVQAVFHDERGPIGWSSACAVRNPPMGRAPARR